ncbi:MAG: APC family permease [Actinomycetota bacterium]
MATTSTGPPTGGRAPRAEVVKRLLLGRAFSSGKLEHTLLPKRLALPVFASDALSSVAYATEEILIVLLTASALSKHLTIPISIAVSVLMVVVISSYRQTIHAYPSGGGAYIVSKANLGMFPGLVAASALLVDYMLTVVVSITAGVYAITSAVPSLRDQRVPMAIAFIALVTLANLRGSKESGVLFAIPTYGFIVAIGAMAVAGLAQCVGGCPPTEIVEAEHHLAAGGGAVGLFVILKAFSSGSTALTGVEAISNGVQAFRRPQAKNAADTLLWMGGIAITMFLAISWLATHIGNVTVSDERTVVGQIAFAVFGGGAGFYIVLVFTALILILAANTAYQDFPRLSAILARDRFMPRQFMNRGDRLVFSNGVIGLGVLASLVIYAFDADLTRVIQMYVVGVFTSFSLSQGGMVVHWLRERDKGVAADPAWRRALVINAVGCVTTTVVLVVVTVTKFAGGAWLSILAMAMLVPVLLSVNRHYESVKLQLRRGAVRVGADGRNHVLLLIRDLDAAAAEAIGYVRASRPASFRVLFPSPTGEVPADVRQRWREFALADPPPIEGLRVEKDDLLVAMRRELKRVAREPEDFVTIVIPELVTGGLLGYLLRARRVIRLKAGLLREPNVVVADVPVAADDRASATTPRSLIPQRTVALVFVSAVHDATVRAVNYARSLDANETRAVYFDLDSEVSHGLIEEWAEKGLDIPLDIVEAPFRDLTEPMQEEVRRFTVREDTVCAVIIPEFVVPTWRHMLLHNQNALFVKRMLLYEPRAVLSSVPFVLEKRSDGAGRQAPDADVRPTGKGS